MNITAEFRRQGRGRFYHSYNVETDKELYTRSKGNSLIAVNKPNDYRIKLWLADNSVASLGGEINGVTVIFHRVRPDLYLYQANLSSEVVLKKILNYEGPVTVSESIDVEAPNFGKSPIEFARQKASDIYKQEGASSTYYFYRGAYRVPDQWRNSEKDKLEKRVEEQIDACNKWLDKWQPFVDWWNDPRLPCTKTRFAEKMGIKDYEQLHPIGARLRYNPKELYSNAIWGVKWFAKKFEDDIEFMKQQILLAETDPFIELIEAAKELGLQLVPNSREWEDGYMWFYHPENPDVLFPYNLLWLNHYHNKYDITDTWRVNTNMTSEEKVKTMDQNSAWYHLDIIGIGGAGGHRVGPNWTLTNRLKAYVRGYTKINVHYKKILWMVKEFAAKNPPDVRWNVPYL